MDPFKPKSWQEMLHEYLTALRNVEPWYPSLLDLDNIELNQPPEPICECGKEKHGFASHSEWCKLWTKK